MKTKEEFIKQYELIAKDNINKVKEDKLKEYNKKRIGCLLRFLIAIIGIILFTYYSCRNFSIAG